MKDTLSGGLEDNFRQLEESLEKLFLEPLEEALSVVEKTLSCRLEEGKKKPSAGELVAAMAEMESILNAFTGRWFLSADAFPIGELLKSYNARLEKILSQEEKSIRKVQAAERFVPLAADPFPVKAGKILKKIHYRARRAFNRSLVLHQVVPNWQLLRFIYRNRLQEGLLPVFKNLLPGSCELHAKLRQAAENIENDYLRKILEQDDPPEGKVTGDPDILGLMGEASAGLKSLREGMIRENRELWTALESEHGRLMDICGTLEFPGSRLWPGRINSGYRRTLERIHDAFTGWGRNHWLLYEDWRFDRKILSLLLDKYEDHGRVVDLYKARVKESIGRFFEEQRTMGKEFLGGLEPGKLDRKQLKNNYRNLKHRSSGSLIHQLSEVQRAGLAGKIRGIAGNFSGKAEEDAADRTFARSFQPGKLARDRDIVKVKPMQLVSLDIAPRLASRLDAVAGEVDEQMDVLVGLMMQYTAIVDFGIASVFKGRREKDKNEGELRETIVESFARANGKITEAEEATSSLDRLVYKDITGILADEAWKLLELQDNESVLALALKLARARTITRLKNFGIRFARHLNSIGKAALRSPVLLYQITREWILKLRRKIGYTSKPVIISTELSDFLSRTDAVFNSLPYIYQRLYYIEPLEDELFFVERTKVLDQINLAYQNWLEDGFSPLVLVGEKGAGATTALTVFRNRTRDYPFYRIRNRGQIYDLELFIQHVSRETGLEPVGDFGGLVDQLNNLPEPSIIILEDLQRYYLRTINGFSILNKIVELISATNQNVLWLTSCTVYAWMYLDRVLSISSFFGFVVRLDDMDGDSIKKVIEQRHRISGFNIRFVPNRLQEKNRKLMRMPEEERQEFLEASYRDSLARFARGNISLALVHWIRSTSDIQDKTVRISSFYEPDSNFLDFLPVDRVLSIYMILIHDGLSEEHLSLILDKSPEEIRIILFQLFDDGILVRNNGLYLLNPLLYRSAVNFLKLKNYLH